MNSAFFKNFRILVAEDDLVLAYDLSHSLKEEGAIVIGPAHSLSNAIELLKQTMEIDGAILDVDLNGETVFPLAEALAQRGTPFVFATASDADTLPAPFGHMPHCQKPVDPARVADALRKAISPFLSPTDLRRRMMGLHE
jgi:CheY-like chemotaxis protein